MRVLIDIDAEGFRKRYLSLLPPVPPELDLDIDEFIYFPSSKVHELLISQDDKELLIRSGLPVEAPPFLSFGAVGDTMLEAIDGQPSCKTIGHTSYGDMICIDETDGGSIVYLTHDRDMMKVFMNSSVRSLAHCLCTYLEFQQSRDVELCRRSIYDFDDRAMNVNSFWYLEVIANAS
jgi:SUKH-4 immunity protein